MDPERGTSIVNGYLMVVDNGADLKSDGVTILTCESGSMEGLAAVG